MVVVVVGEQDTDVGQRKVDNQKYEGSSDGTH
jgi:hypothetical protein